MVSSSGTEMLVRTMPGPFCSALQCTPQPSYGQKFIWGKWVLSVRNQGWFVPLTATEIIDLTDHNLIPSLLFGLLIPSRHVLGHGKGEQDTVTHLIPLGTPSLPRWAHDPMCHYLLYVSSNSGGEWPHSTSSSPYTITVESKIMETFLVLRKIFCVGCWLIQSV